MSEESKEMLQKVLRLYNVVGYLIDRNDCLYEDDIEFVHMVNELEEILGVSFDCSY